MVLAGYTLNNSAGRAASTRQSISNFIIATISFVIAVNSFEAIVDIVHQINLIFKKWYARWRASIKISKRKIVPVKPIKD